MTDQEKYIELTATIRGRETAINHFFDSIVGKSLSDYSVVRKAKAQREELRELIELINKLNDSTSN